MRIAINPRHPEPRKISQAVEVMRRGGVIAYPTDTVYGLGCDIFDKRAVEKIYRMKRMESSQLLSFVCPDMSSVSRYAVVNDWAYRIMRSLLPGPYTFILRPTREVPKVLRMKRKTVGIRMPDHAVATALVEGLGHPVASSSASIDGEQMIDPADMERRFPQLELVLDAEGCGLTPSTVVDLSGDEPLVVRMGAGPVDW
ncbi:MAG: L-threonylcarbamoyladenylate synthase [Myxococcales bacterium]|nr:L-threonylcarbamoyladenylate synthase [Myxococcales bacterium]MDD9965710.1 L-threonylcarbamoyladenylate synthase [Myxococcales bacterium]